MKKLLNFHEEATHQRLQEVCEQNGSRVFAKVRLADVLPIEESGITAEDYRFALQSHFDFVVTDSSNSTLFAVEFDGPSHETEEQVRRDSVKNRLCERFRLPLLRVNANYLFKKYHRMDVLTWLIESWFMEQDFNAQQEAGNIPYDEAFDPFMVIADPTKEGPFPYWLAREQQIKIHNLFDAGHIKNPIPSHMIARDEKGNYHAIAWIYVTDHRGVYVESGMRSQLFTPVLILGILEEILIIELYERLVRVLKGEQEPLLSWEIKLRLQQFKQSYPLASGAWYGEEPV